MMKSLMLNEESSIDTRPTQQCKAGEKNEKGASSVKDIAIASSSLSRFPSPKDSLDAIAYTDPVET